MSGSDIRTGGQASYQIYSDLIYAGGISDIQEGNVVRSMTNITDNVYYGRFVKRIAASEVGVGQPTTDADDYLGVSVRDIADTGAGYYVPGRTLPVIVKGFVAVEVDQDVTVDDPVYARFTTAGGGLDLGVCRKDADTAKAVLISGARFVKNSFTDKFGVKIAIVELSLQ